MKLVYIADNRTRGNFGCRATSTALAQIVGEENEIVGRVMGTYTHFDMGDLFFVSWMPAIVYRLLAKIPGWNKIKRIRMKFLKKILGEKIHMGVFDYVKEDPYKSIKNLKKCLIANDFLNSYNLENYEYDGIFINGEGSFIFSTPPRREVLIISMFMAWAKENNKKVFFLNAMFSSCPYSGNNRKTIKMVDNLLCNADYVSVREYDSLSFAKKYFPKVKVRLIPDALFTWYKMINDSFKVENGKYFIPHHSECDSYYNSLDFKKPYICVAGSSSEKIWENLDLTVYAYCQLITELKNRFQLQIFLVHVDEGDTFLKSVAERMGIPLIPMEFPIVAAGKILSNARVFVSGRYHPAILASLGGTPCVFMGSNSHKTISLQRLMEYDEPVEFDLIPNKKECDKICNKVGEILCEGEVLRRRIKEQARKLSIDAETKIKAIV